LTLWDHPQLDGRAYAPEIVNRPVVHALDILTTVIVKNADIWGISLCNLTDNYEHFGGTYYLHLQDRKVGREGEPCSH
jgi:hypothetical protein